MELLTPFRGVAALGVVLFHWTPHLPRLGDAEAPWHGWIASGYLWVDFFFVLSGFVLAHVYGGLGLRGTEVRRYLVARISRIWPLHLLALSVLVAVELAKAVAGGDAFSAPFRDLWGLATQVTLLNAVGLDDDLTWNKPAWSIGAEWIAYLAFPLLALALRRTGRGLAVPAAAALLAGVAGLAGLRGHLDLTWDLGAVRCLLEFSLGMLAYRHVHARDGLVGAGDAGVLASLLPVVVLLGLAPSAVRDAALVPLFVVLVLVLAGAEGSRTHALLGSTAARRVGDASYAIYLLHSLVNPWLRRLSGPLDSGLEDVSWSLALGVEAHVFVALTVGLILVSDQVYRRFEVPAKRRIRAWASGERT